MKHLIEGIVTFVVLVFLFIGLLVDSPSEKLKGFEKDKAECAVFKKEYDELKLPENYDSGFLVKLKIKNCKGMGAW